MSVATGTPSPPLPGKAAGGRVLQTPPPRTGRVVAVCVSAGGIPKLPTEQVLIQQDGLEGDRHAHAKHCRPDRAVSLLDVEVMQELVAEGFPLVPGATGENLSIQGLHVQSLAPGMVLRVGEAMLRLTAPRKPCYVLDAIHPCLKDAIVGRCGYLAEVLAPGVVRTGDEVSVVPVAEGGEGDRSGSEESRPGA
ncbi:MAG: MOSC domain-containing protein [Pirellulales bacterium]|nr:MOSC domain-containing protein [Pirellulales bacterium]